MLHSALGCRYSRRAFGYSVPIGALGGLIGLGGGEFRLPVLMHVVGFDARSAIPLNLATSLITLAFALLFRSQSVSLSAMLPYLPAIIGLAAGGMASAYHGPRIVKRLSDRRLIILISGLLAALGVLLLVEALFPFEIGMLPNSVALHAGLGFIIGVGIGLVSSMLGVAGGELLIPTLLFIFAVDIKTAGSASALISLGVVLVGLWRYWRMGTIPTGRGAQRITFAMGIGSILGAALGGLVIAFAPVAFLKLLLGSVLIAAAIKTVSHSPAG